MADLTDFERKANQYLTEHVSGGGRREDVLADWIRSDNPDLQNYAKNLLASDLNPPKQEEVNIPAGPSYLQMAKDIAPVVAPAAALSAGAYYLGKKKGQAIAPPATTPNAPADMAPSNPPANAIDELQAARIREANAKAAHAEWKFEQAKLAAQKELETPVKTAPAAKQPYTEQEHGFAQSGGQAGASKELHQKYPLNELAATPDPIETTATPAQKQAAVAAVKQEKLKNPRSPVAQAEEQGFKTYIKKAEQITGAAGSAVSPESRRTPAETAISKQEMPLNKGVNQVRAALGYYKDSPIDPKAAQAAYNTAFERGLISEKNVGVGGMNPSAAATIADISANPDLYPKEVVQHVKTMSEKYGKKPPSSSQAGFVTTQMPTELTPFGRSVAQVGKQVVGDLKMGAAAIPFALATDVRQADVGARREMVQQLKTEKDPQRIAELQGEIKKIDDGLFLQQMYKHFVEKNVPKQYRPAFSR